MTDEATDLPEGFRPDDPTAPDRVHKEFARVVFSIGEHADGRPYIRIEHEAGLTILKYGDAKLALEVREGITFEEAKDLAALMRHKVRGLSFTKSLT